MIRYWINNSGTLVGFVAISKILMFELQFPKHQWRCILNFGAVLVVRLRAVVALRGASGRG